MPPIPEPPQGIGYSVPPAHRQGKGEPDRYTITIIGTVRLYPYTSTVNMLEDFWSEVDAVLKERGVK